MKYCNCCGSGGTSNSLFLFLNWGRPPLLGYPLKGNTISSKCILRCAESVPSVISVEWSPIDSSIFTCNRRICYINCTSAKYISERHSCRHAHTQIHRHRHRHTDTHTYTQTYMDTHTHTQTYTHKFSNKTCVATQSFSVNINT